jgi:hypothetical protein
MAGTYEPIATNTLSSAAATVTFSSIPATYTDLVLSSNFAFTNATAYPNPRIRLNADSSTYYQLQALYGQASAAGYTIVNYTHAYVSSASGGGGGLDKFLIQCDFQDYTNTTSYKAFLYRVNTTVSESLIGVATWKSTAAINTIEWSLQSNTYAVGSTFTLYGIKAA